MTWKFTLLRVTTQSFSQGLFIRSFIYLFLFYLQVTFSSVQTYPRDRVPLPWCSVAAANVFGFDVTLASNLMVLLVAFKAWQQKRLDWSFTALEPCSHNNYCVLVSISDMKAFADIMGHDESRANVSRRAFPHSPPTGGEITLTDRYKEQIGSFWSDCTIPHVTHSGLTPPEDWGSVLRTTPLNKNSFHASPNVPRSLGAHTQKSVKTNLKTIFN